MVFARTRCRCDSERHRSIHRREMPSGADQKLRDGVPHFGGECLSVSWSSKIRISHLSSQHVICYVVKSHVICSLLRKKWLLPMFVVVSMSQSQPLWQVPHLSRVELIWAILRWARLEWREWAPQWVSLQTSLLWPRSRSRRGVGYVGKSPVRSPLKSDLRLTIFSQIWHWPVRVFVEGSLWWMYQAYRYDAEINERNAPMTDEEPCSFSPRSTGCLQKWFGSIELGLWYFIQFHASHLNLNLTMIQPWLNLT